MMENFSRMVDRINEISRRFNMPFSTGLPPTAEKNLGRSVSFENMLEDETAKLAKVESLIDQDKDLKLEEKGSLEGEKTGLSGGGSSYLDLVNRYSRRYGISPKLVDALIRVESDYDNYSKSHKGALGLMQLMPETAEEMGVRDPFDPEENIMGGTKYLKSLIDKFGDLKLALAAYNSGPNRVASYGGVPPFRETQDYVSKVLSIYRNNR